VRSSCRTFSVSLTDLHEILAAIIRAALADQALASGLEGRIGEMEARRDRLQDRAAKRRQIAKDAMVELDLKKLSAPDFTASIRPGTPALMVIDEAAVPSIYWEPREPRSTGRNWRMISNKARKLLALSSRTQSQS
jgi:hypothetical protein